MPAKSGRARHWAAEIRCGGFRSSMSDVRERERKREGKRERGVCGGKGVCVYERERKREKMYV